MTTSQRTTVCPRSVLERSAPCHPPTLTCDPISRPELIERLESIGSQQGARIVALFAPAGTGKTVLLLDWIERRLRRRAPQTTVGWLTVTEAVDADLSRWPLTAAALCSALGVPAPPPGVTSPVRFATHLADVLADRTAPTVLVIDDAHHLTDSHLLVAVEYLIRHLPPTVTVVLSGRYEPPLRWHTLKAEGRLTRIDKWDLALTRSQVSQLLDRFDWTATDTELDTVTELTRGWTALVRIAAISVTGGAQDRAAALAVLARPAQAVVDFLNAEILYPLPAHLLEFLFRTSVPERFTEPLADELYGTRTHEIVNELQRTGFPLTRTSEDGQLWFTYHPMVRAHLLAEARSRSDAEVSDCHRRSARWLSEAGHPAAAIPHLLALHDREPFRAFLRDHALGLVFDGEGPRLLDAIDRAGAAFSDDPFVWRLRAIDALTRGQDRETLAYVDLLRAQPKSIPSLAPRHWLDVLEFAATIDAVITAGAGIDNLEVPEEMPSATGNLDIDCYLTVQAASAMLLHDRIERGEALLRSSITLAERTGRHRLVLRSMTRLTVAAAYAGAITTTRVRAEHAVAYATEHDLEDSPDTDRMRISAALTSYVQGAPFDDQPIAEIAERMSEQEYSGMPITNLPTQVACRLLLSRTSSDRYAAVHRLRTGLMRLLRCDPLPLGNAGLMVPMTVRGLLALREPHAAGELVERARAVLGETPEVVLGQAMVVDAAHKPRSARALLEPLVQRSASLYPVTALSVWLNYAGVLHRLGLASKTAQALEAALRITDTGMLVSPWLDIPEAIELLDAYTGRFGRLDALADTLRHHPSAQREDSVPALTESEAIVLKHLPSGRTTGQIAADLGVSINTIKTHLRGVYTKLEANTRADAVERARQVGLL